MRKHYSSSNNATAEGGDSAVDSSSASHDTKGISATPSFTQEQYDKLMTLIQSSSIAHSNLCFSFSCHNIALDTWIIDSGASHHICASLHWFHSYSEINPMVIKLPNGDHVTTKYAGTLIFSSLFRLTSVLFLPNFNINLIYVSLLCHNALCYVHFTDTNCLIQEQKSLKMIGLAEKKDGLYYLVQTNKVASSSPSFTSHSIFCKSCSSP
jgi:hypothetical protein